jgi:proline iminopeptidase
MKTLSYIIILIIAFTFFECKHHNQVNKKKEELSVSKSGELVFGDKKVTYFIEGQGVPCIVCADANLQSNCLSENLKKNFQFIFSEPRISTYNAKDYSSLSMDTIVDDIDILRKKLGFDKIYVLGHSICGLMALEYARKYPQNTNGVIMINTPPHYHNDYWDIVSHNWDTKASAERKMIYKTNKSRLSKMNIDSLSEIDRSFEEYKSSVPMYFRDSVYDVTSTFRNIQRITKGWDHFFTIMLDYDIARSEIKVPVFLSLGAYDFMTPQSLWDDYINKLPSMTVNRFKKSGHFPQVEEQELFDHQLLDWLKINKN